MKTHCRRGHELTDENVYVTKKSGQRHCKICRKAEASVWQKKDYEKNPEKYAARGFAQDQKSNVKQRRKDFYYQTRNAVWRRYSVLKSTAKKLGRDFTLTQEDYGALVVDNKCHYCSGCLPEAGCGLDRLDNRIGYVHGNVVPCCERCNEHKGRLEGIGFRSPRTVELLMELRANV